MKSLHQFTVRVITPEDAPWVTSVLIENWNAKLIASHGELIDATMLPSFVAIGNGGPIGLLTYRIKNGQCEIVTLNASQEKIGVGSALLERTVQTARQNNCSRLWLITTNDNLDAIRFYFKRGMRLVAVHLNALDESRALKPSIPLRGNYGLPLQDELEFELSLKS